MGRSSANSLSVHFYILQCAKLKHGLSLLPRYFLVSHVPFSIHQIRVTSLFPFLLQEDDSSQDSDAEFEQMLAEAEDMNKAEDEAELVTGSKKKSKTKIGNKSKRRKRMKAKDEDGYETDHQVSINKICFWHIYCQPFDYLSVICSCSDLIFKKWFIEKFKTFTQTKILDAAHNLSLLPLYNIGMGILIAFMI